MAKWCWNWPYCACGVRQAKDLAEAESRMLVYRNDVGDIKRVPVSELITFALVEALAEDQYSAGCPKTRGDQEGAKKGAKKT